MTRDEYYQQIKEAWANVDKKDRNAIHNFNVWRNNLAKEMYAEEERRNEANKRTV